MHTKSILFCGRQVVLACDGNCDKAWGIECRPNLQLDPADDDDIAYLSDAELGDAPADPGTYEGGHAKPAGPHDMNKWCARQCERSELVDQGEEIVLLDWSKRVLNKPSKHRADARTTTAAQGVGPAGRE